VLRGVWGLWLGVVLWLCVLACWGVCGVSAQARTVHVFAGSFGSGGPGPGQFKEPGGVAVNGSMEPLVQSAAGDVYVVDKGDNRVERFSSSGSYLGQFDGSGTFEVEGKVATGAAAPTGQFTEPFLIAVDNSGSPLDPSNGDVYVVDNGHGVIDKFTEIGAYVGQLTGRCEKEKESPPCEKSKFIPFIKGESGIVGVAVDPAGMLWVDEKSGGVENFGDALVNEYISSRETVFGPGIVNLGVDSKDDLYVTLGLEPNVKVNDLGEPLVDPFGPKEPTSGIAVDSTHGEVYIDYDTSIGAFTLGGSEIERFGSGHFPLGQFVNTGSKGVAVDASNGTVYATAFTANDVVIFDAVTLPTVSLGALGEQSPRGVTLNGTVNPEGFAVTSCVFEYDTRQYVEGEAPHGSGEACNPAGIGSGSTPVAVSGRLEGLTPETKYYYRLVAENTGGASETMGEFTAGPIFGGEFVTNVASESATLNVPVDPNGDDTHYYFQFGRSASYEFDAPVSSPGVDIGSVPGVQNIGVHVQRDLAPGVVYHYRVVVLQGGEEFVGPDRVFTTRRVVAGPVLADGRAWELVSPANKKGALIEPFSQTVGDDIQAAGNGSAITYLAAGPAVGEGPQGKINWSQTLSVRHAGGWGSEDLSVPRRISGGEEEAAAGGAREEYDVFSRDLSLAVVEPLVSGTPPLSPGAPARTIYLRDNLQGSYTPLVWAGNVPNPEELVWGPESEEQLYFVTASSDLSHILLASPLVFTPEAVYGGKEYLKHNQWNLYEWSAGALQLVNILPQSEGGEPTNRPEPSVRLADGTVKEGKPEGVSPSAVSSDGRRVAWDLGVPGEGGGYKGLYVRDMVDRETVKVSGPNSVFQWMSSDGSKVFYIEEVKVGEVASKDLFVFDFDTGTRTDLTADHGEEDGGVQRLVSDVSRDGSYVYFVATGVLAEASGAVSGGNNLYLLHDNGGVWSTTYIATLGPEDAKSWDQKAGDSFALVSDLSGISSRVSPDGRYLAFMSNRSLTGYDNTDMVSGLPDEEVYLFDAQTGRLVCASCNPTGARPVGAFDQKHAPLLVDRGENWAGSWLGGSIPGWDKNFTAGSQYQPRYLFDSGRLFFSSADALVPHATNGVENVYEYQPVGVGGCVEGLSLGSVVYVASSSGCVGLISAGPSGQESAFFDASENGNDVFFITAAKLVGTDYDNGYDVYDAHVCSSEGVPCVNPPVPSPSCSSGDSCKAAPSLQPEIFGPAPSATFSGTGNAIEETKPATKNKKPKKKAKKKHKTKKAKKAGRAKKKHVLPSGESR
jgi:hypothetical protein